MATGLTLEALSAPIDKAADATPLDRLGAAAATANELRGLSDALLDRYVQAARADGSSWTEIGAALGVTKQAAQQRFAKRADVLRARLIQVCDAIATVPQRQG